MACNRLHLSYSFHILLACPGQTFGEKTSRERPFSALRVTLLESCAGCHPERSEGSVRPTSQTFRGVSPERSAWAQGDRRYLQMSTARKRALATSWRPMISH